MNAPAKPCSSSSEACVRRCRKATSRAKRRRSTRRSPRLRKDTRRRIRPRLPLRRRRLAPESQSRRRGPFRRRPRNSPRSSVQARLRRQGRPPLRSDRLHKPVRQANPGLEPRPFRTRRSDLPRQRREGASQPGAHTKRQLRLRAGQPRWGRRWLRQLDPSWLLQWPTSLLPHRGPAGQFPPWERQAARMRACPDWRRSTRRRRSDRTRPTMAPGSTLRPSSRPVAMNPGNGPTRPRWRRSSTVPVWRPDRKRRPSARSRRAPKSPSQND